MLRNRGDLGAQGEFDEFQPSKQANKQTSKQANKQTSKDHPMSIKKLLDMLTIAWNEQDVDTNPFACLPKTAPITSLAGQRTWAEVTPAMPPFARC